MGRPSKLTPEQWAEVERRIAAGEGPSAIAREFGVNPSQITRRVSHNAQKVRDVAIRIAESQTALAALPLPQQYNAINLASKLRAISDSLASAAQHGAATAHRLSALANAEVAKVEDADPLASMEALKGVSALTKLANDAASIPLNLLAANKETVKALNDEKPAEDLPPLRPQISRDEWMKLHSA